MTSAGRNLFHGRQHFELRSSVCIGPHRVPICLGIAPKRHHLPNSPLGCAYPSAAVVDCPVCVVYQLTRRLGNRPRLRMGRRSPTASSEDDVVRSHFHRPTEGWT
jgi:hypothetical protein